MDMNEMHEMAIGAVEFAKTELARTMGPADMPPITIVLRRTDQQVLLDGWDDDGRETRARLWMALGGLLSPRAMTLASEVWMRSVPDNAAHRDEVNNYRPGKNQELYEAGDPSVSEAITVMTVHVNPQRPPLFYTRPFSYNDDGVLVWGEAVRDHDASHADGWVLDMLREAMRTNAEVEALRADIAIATQEDLVAACGALADVFGGRVAIVMPATS